MIRSAAGLIFFFFQAEDGIRDVAVTGVQTCALPIFAFFLCVLWLGCVGRRGNQAEYGSQESGKTEHPRSVVHKKSASHGSVSRLNAEIGRASCRERV